MKKCEDCKYCEGMEIHRTDYHSSDGIKIVAEFLGCAKYYDDHPKAKYRCLPIEDFNADDCEDWTKE